MLPNFRSVSAGETVPEETPQEKFVTATLDNFDYTSLFFAGVIAANSFVTKATPEFHQGAAGYGRYDWHTVADQAVENYFVELIVPATLPTRIRATTRWARRAAASGSGQATR